MALLLLLGITIAESVDDEDEDEEDAAGKEAPGMSSVIPGRRREANKDGDCPWELDMEPLLSSPEDEDPATPVALTAGTGDCTVEMVNRVGGKPWDCCDAVAVEPGLPPRY